LPLEGRWAFYSREIRAMVSKHVHFVRMYWGYRRILRRVERDAATHADVAMNPVRPSDFDELEIFTATPAAKLAAERQLHRMIMPARVRN